MSEISSKQEIDLVDLSKKLWEKRNIVVKYGIIGFIVGVIVAISIPKKYNVEVKIAPESSKQANTSSLGGIASMMGISSLQGSSGVNEIVFPVIIASSPFLSEFEDIEVTLNDEKISLYSYMLDKQKTAWWNKIIALPSKAIGFVVGLIKGDDKNSDNNLRSKDIFRPDIKQVEFEGKLSNAIAIEKDKLTNVTSIAVTMQNGEIAAIVADSILSKLQQYMSLYHTSKSRNELIQSEKLLKKAKKEYYAADNKYAEALDRNQNLISERAKALIERLSNEKQLMFDIYQQAAMRVELTKMKLNEETPIATVIQPSRVPIKAASPNKMVITLGFAFLFGFVVVIKTIFNELK